MGMGMRNPRLFQLGMGMGIGMYISPPRDGNGLGRARIVPTRNPTRQKKIRQLLARLSVGYLLKKYPQIFLKLTGTRGYPIPANI